MTDPKVTIKNGSTITNSRDLADFFEKRHDNVLRKIEKFLTECDDKEFTDLNFEASTYIDDSGRECKCYNLTRSGYDIVVFGFTGTKARQFQVAYVKRFEIMEKMLKDNLNIFVTGKDPHAHLEFYQKLPANEVPEGFKPLKDWYKIKGDSVPFNARGAISKAFGEFCLRNGFKAFKRLDDEYGTVNVFSETAYDSFAPTLKFAVQLYYTGKKA